MHWCGDIWHDLIANFSYLMTLLAFGVGTIFGLGSYFCALLEKAKNKIYNFFSSFKRKDK